MQQTLSTRTRLLTSSKKQRQDKPKTQQDMHSRKWGTWNQRASALLPSGFLQLGGVLESCTAYMPHHFSPAVWLTCQCMLKQKFWACSEYCASSEKWEATTTGGEMHSCPQMVSSGSRFPEHLVCYFSKPLSLDTKTTASCIKICPGVPWRYSVCIWSWPEK